MTPSTSQRFQALDVFRGMTVCFMIIVNTPGNGDTSFAPLHHAKWHGFTPTDLVFPSFLFAVGNAMAFVMPKWAAMPRAAVLQKIFKRTFIIFLLGYLMYWFPFMKWQDGQLTFFPWAETRVFGVLQRIALCYGAVALMLVYWKPRTVYIISGIALLLYWWLLYACAPVGADPLSLEGNAVRLLDQWLIGEKHMYHGNGIDFDPEGLLSTLPALANVVAGYAAGVLVLRRGKTWETLGRLMLAGFVCLTLVYVWDPFFPVNKKLWTSSFVLITVGLDLMILAGLMYIIDFAHRVKWTGFFEVFGKNPLFIYLLSELIAIMLWFLKDSHGEAWYRLLYQRVFKPAGDYTGSLLFALSVMMVCWVVGYWMDRRRIYIRV